MLALGVELRSTDLQTKLNHRNRQVSKGRFVAVELFVKMTHLVAHDDAIGLT